MFLTRNCSERITNIFKLYKHQWEKFIKKIFNITSTVAAEEWWSNASCRRDKIVTFHYYA